MGLRTTARRTVSMFLDNFTGDGSTTAFTLSNSASVNDVFVFYNGVCMKPTTDYGISGATNTFTFTPVNNSQNNGEVFRIMGPSNAKNLAELLNTDTTVAVADVADGSITTAKLAADAVTTAKIADDAVSSAKLFATNLGRRNIVINGAMQVVKDTSATGRGVVLQ